MIQSKERQAEALVALVPHLPGEQRAVALQPGLEVALLIGNEWARAEALTALAPQLPGPLLQRALEAPLMIRDEWERAKALVALAPQLPDEPRAVALQQSLEAALMIQDEGWRAQVLRVLAPQLSGPLLQYGLEATRKNEMWRMWVPAALFSRRSDLAPMLPSVRYALANHLLTLKDRRRRDVLMFCATESLFTPPILSPATVSLLAAHIAEICQEWRWL